MLGCFYFIEILYMLVFWHLQVRKPMEGCTPRNLDQDVSLLLWPSWLPGRLPDIAPPSSAGQLSFSLSLSLSLSLSVSLCLSLSLSSFSSILCLHQSEHLIMYTIIVLFDYEFLRQGLRCLSLFLPWLVQGIIHGRNSVYLLSGWVETCIEILMYFCQSLDFFNWLSFMNCFYAFTNYRCSCNHFKQFRSTHGGK
jgi:hypothetical protein